MSALLLTGSMPEYISGIEGAYAMRWFQKDRPPDVWEFAADQPLGDIGAAQKIREICASAGSIAETMAALSGRKTETQKASEAERYQAAVKCALELAKQYQPTAVSLLDAQNGQLQSRVVPCRVQFRMLNDARIESYLRREQPYDCAGSAKVEGLGIALIARMETADPTSIIGLPLIALTEMLERAGLPVI